MPTTPLYTVKSVSSDAPVYRCHVSTLGAWVGILRIALAATGGCAAR
ncbi:hypothetical protein [Glaciimonas sp. PCH181]|nr:hypothetical protein [Glaciimonas sp. PCH181]